MLNVWVVDLILSNTMDLCVSVVCVCLLVSLCAVYHKDVASYGGACHVKITHLSARPAHVCFCCVLECVCVSQCGAYSEDFLFFVHAYGEVHPSVERRSMCVCVTRVCLSVSVQRTTKMSHLLVVRILSR